MEQDQKRKRGREDESEMECFENKGKKRDVLMEEKELAVGVFDFPWLKEKDGVSESEDYFEDKFASSLQVDQDGASFSIEFFIPEAKLEDDAWHPFESETLELQADDADCIWSSLLNQPL
ncbi:hypothetical protein SESBI_29587 [Sesbania bispinosa]|nr:hypothetical protein SESBI_29587 [Sesbania bispinosa]